MLTALTTPLFDARLDSSLLAPNRNARLTLRLRLALRQLDPAGGGERGYYPDYGDPAEPLRPIRRWSAAAWELWKRRFTQVVEGYWSRRFWLENNFSGLPSLEFERNGYVYRSQIQCRLRLQLVSTPSSAHATVDVVRLAPGARAFGSHTALFSSRDLGLIRKDRTADGRRIRQRTVAHEIGHLLGLEHVDVGKPHCPPSNTNAFACYGVDDVDVAAVMGAGMTLRTENARPWREMMIRMTGRGSLTHPHDWRASLIPLPPRLIGERRVAVGAFR